jgi:hypothetical protein
VREGTEPKSQRESESTRRLLEMLICGWCAFAHLSMASGLRLALFVRLLPPPLVEPWPTLL